MANEALRVALGRREWTPQQLAEAVGVDAKTIERWLRDESRLPHPRHRYAAAAALHTEEHLIWPRAVRATIKTGTDREVVTCYPSRSAIPSKLWHDLIGGAKRQMVFAGYTSYFLWLEVPNLARVLADKAAGGVAIRFLVGDPNSRVTHEREQLEKAPLNLGTRIRVTLDELGKLNQPLIPARLSDRHIYMSVWRFDDEMLMATHIADKLGHDSPTLHLQRKQDGGLFDQYVEHVEHLWDAAGPAEVQ